MMGDRNIWTIAKSLLSELGLENTLDLCAERLDAAANDMIAFAGWKQIENATLALADTAVAGRTVH